MPEVPQSEIATAELAPEPQRATFDQLVKLAKEVCAKPRNEQLVDSGRDGFGVKNYEHLLQDPAAWRRTYVGLYS